MSDLHPPSFALERWHRAGRGPALRNFVFGTADGLVTVLAFVAGVSASLGDRMTVLVAGVAEMFAGALSMGLGAWLGARAERDLYHRERAREEREVKEVPQLEKDELREIYAKKGFSGADLERVVEVLTENQKRWVDVMMAEELGLAEAQDSPLKSGIIVGVSYICAAAIPLLPYLLLDARRALPASLALTGAALVSVGVVKARFTQRTPWKSGLETLLAGYGGTLLCFGIGHLTSMLIGRHP